MDPEKVVLDRCLKDAIRRAARMDLSELETNVLNAFLAGKTYDEMADELSCRTKSIDNALQRVKRKIGERVLAEAG